MSTIAMSGLYERTFSNSSSAVPACPTISYPAVARRLAMPSRKSTVSSATTTRIRVASRCCCCGDSASTPPVSPTTAIGTNSSRSARRREQRLHCGRGKLAFRDEAERRAALDERPEVGAAEGRRQDHLERQIETREPLGDLEPVDVGQLNIEQHQVRTVLQRPFDGAGAGFCLRDHRESMALEQLTRRFPEAAVVVDEENATSHQAIVPAHAAGRSVAGPTL